MSSLKYRAPAGILFLAATALLVANRATHGQVAEPEEGRFKTADGLRLYYQWYSGGKGEKSDSVILVHNYGSDSSKGPWTTLAKALQKQGYSVLQFDLRGHGKSADFKAMDKADVFCAQRYNSYAGSGLNANSIKDLKKERFSAAYYPYLVNDLTAARRFLDDQNDATQCNSGRVFVVAEQTICPLVMLWASTEFARYGFGPANKTDEPPKVSAGQDLCGIVFLSWSNAAGPGGTAIGVANRIMTSERELSAMDLVPASTVNLIGNLIKKKVAMAFIYGKDDRGSATEARNWFNRFVGPGTKTDDPELKKYIREVPGADKLAGIKLLDIMEKQKDAEEKVSHLEGKIVEFFKVTKTNAINGGNWKKRQMDNLDAIPVPLDLWGLKKP